MSLLLTLQNDAKTALKEKKEVAKSTLRMLISAVSYARIAKGRELSDEEVTDVLIREAKHRRESIDAARKGGREDFAANEEAELEVISKYLPKALTEEEITQIVKKTIAEVGAVAPGDRGKVMGPVMKQLKGKADGRTVGSIVEKLLRS